MTFWLMTSEHELLRRRLHATSLVTSRKFGPAYSFPSFLDYIKITAIKSANNKTVVRKRMKKCSADYNLQVCIINILSNIISDLFPSARYCILEISNNQTTI